MSRAPIREALIELHSQGLVELDSTGHARIPKLEAEDIEEIHTIRLMIDPVAASLAAGHAKADTFKALEANIAATGSAKKLADVSRLDTEFHDLIVRAAKHRRLLVCWNVFRDHVGLWLAQMHLRHQAVTRDTRQWTVEAHLALLDSIRAGDAQRAADEARRHVAGWIELMPRV